MDNKNEVKIPWGLSYYEFPVGTEVAWGARTILDHGQFSILGDRQGFSSLDKTAVTLSERINAVLPEVQGFVKGKRDSREMRSEEAREFKFVASNGVTFVMNTNGSYGYLYMAAF